MSEERVIASRLLQAAENVLHGETAEERNFTSLVRDTRRCFRRNEVASSPNRGRKRKKTFKKEVVLMKLAHADFFLSNSELKFLKQRGLGKPDISLEIGREESSVEIMENIISLFNSNIQNLLRTCEFKLAKSGRSKRRHRIGDFQDGADFELKILQSKIIILPEKDFPCDLPIFEEQDTVSSEASSRNVSQPSTSRVLSTSRGSDSDDFQPQQSSSSRSYRNVRARENYVSRIQSQRIEESESEDLDEDDNELSIIEESHANNDHVLLPSLPKDAEIATIAVSRNNCVTGLLNIYKDEEILDKKLDVSFLGEVGIDGLTKELFNIFFEQSENILLQGEDCLVPYLPLNKRNEQDNFIYFGQILQHMLVLTQTVPSKLSRITLVLIANPEAEIKPDIILKELNLYVNPYLRKILKKGQKNFSSLTDIETEFVQDFFQTNKFLARPNAQTFVEQLQIIGTEILIEIPRRLIDKIRQGVSPQDHPRFWSNCDFDVLTDMQSVTVTKVINCLETDLNLTNEENEVLHYFEMYVNCLDKDKLAKLVFMITGSFLMPNCIYIKFNDLVGLSQRPIFSTCTDTLTLPKTYANYTELKNDFNICLTTDEAKEYTSY